MFSYNSICLSISELYSYCAFFFPLVCLFLAEIAPTAFPFLKMRLRYLIYILNILTLPHPNYKTIIPWFWGKITQCLLYNCYKNYSQPRFLGAVTSCPSGTLVFITTSVWSFSSRLVYTARSRFWFSSQHATEDALPIRQALPPTLLLECPVKGPGLPHPPRATFPLGWRPWGYPRSCTCYSVVKSFTLFLRQTPRPSPALVTTSVWMEPPPAVAS